MSIPIAQQNAAASRPMGIPSGDFLATVRAALGREDAPPAEAYPRLLDDLAAVESQAAAARERIANQLPDLMSRMADTAAQRGWNVARCAGIEDALDYVVSLAERLNAVSVARSQQAVFDALPVDGALAGAGALCWPAVYDGAESRAAVRRRLEECALGITGADYAVAETGSVIVLPRRGLSRLVSVVPPVHLAIVRPQDVIDSLDDLFTLRRLEFYRNGAEGSADMGSYLNFITGPSRTADIEQTIVVGVHGPKEVHLMMLEQE